MSQDQKAQEINRTWWNERAGFHLETAFYQNFQRRLADGGHALLPREVEELGDISGLDVLHVQCHVGTDTLSLVRLGAHTTGIDFSPVAVEKARNLAEALGIPSRFEQAEIGSLRARFGPQFDLVFTSYGVLSWLPDLSLWAHNIAGCLRPGGRFYIIEGHPLAYAIADEANISGGRLELEYPYLAQTKAQPFNGSGSYADRERSTTANDTREWSWGLGDITNALMEAGLQLRWLREHPEGFCPIHPAMKQCADGHYRFPAPIHGRFPMTFSIMADKLPKPIHG